MALCVLSAAALQIIRVLETANPERAAALLAKVGHSSERVAEIMAHLEGPTAIEEAAAEGSKPCPHCSRIVSATCRVCPRCERRLV